MGAQKFGKGSREQQKIGWIKEHEKLSGSERKNKKEQGAKRDEKGSSENGVKCGRHEGSREHSMLGLNPGHGTKCARLEAHRTLVLGIIHQLLYFYVFTSQMSTIA